MFEVMRSVPAEQLNNKDEADSVLKQHLPHLSKSERNYLLSNLVRQVTCLNSTQEEKEEEEEATYLCTALTFLFLFLSSQKNGSVPSYRWRINLDVLSRDQGHVQDFPIDQIAQSQGKVFFNFPFLFRCGS